VLSCIGSDVLAGPLPEAPGGVGYQYNRPRNEFGGHPELAAVAMLSADQARLAVHSEDNRLTDIRNSVTVDIQTVVPAVIKEEDLEEDMAGAIAEG